MRLLSILPIACAALLVARGACAQSEAPAHLELPKADFSQARAASVPVTRPAGVAAPATPDLADPLDPLATPKRVANSLNSEVFATTAVDRKFGKRDDLTGAFGVLCGRQPEHTESGGAAAYGSDPHGRFVGAKLSLAF